MHAKRKALLAVFMLISAAALAGCTANTAPASTAAPKAMQQQTAEPATAQPTAEATAQAPKEQMLSLQVSGSPLDAQAISAGEELLLPLEQTGEALGWKASSEESEEENQIKRTVTLEKEDSRITVSWTVSDNTVKNIAWQKDGLLIPVDTRLSTRDSVVYVPAAFFEEAMDVRIAKTNTSVMMSTPEPMDTPQTMEDSSGENG
ncbi:MAG: hypothetical protein IJB85_12190 [Clostridia bacterium]|nr:hypothetical protein [Clostridia bacterium]